MTSVCWYGVRQEAKLRSYLLFPPLISAADGDGVPPEPGGRSCWFALELLMKGVPDLGCVCQAFAVPKMPANLTPSWL